MPAKVTGTGKESKHMTASKQCEIRDDHAQKENRAYTISDISAAISMYALH
jgi:hypothetical protein